MYEFWLKRRGTTHEKFRAGADLEKPSDVRKLMVDALARAKYPESRIGEFELEIRDLRGRTVTTYVTAAGGR